jgi:L-threonylcarbamoyladenylate synthase
LQLLRCSGPLATSSANRSGEPACRTAAELARCFPEVSRLEPEPWLPGSGQASTVVSWQSDGWRVLRQGQVVVPEIPAP